MKVAVFSTKPYDREFLTAANNGRHSLTFLTPRLSEETVSLARGFAAVCVFVNDRLDRDVLKSLAAGGTKIVALRCAGFNNVDLAAAGELGIAVVRVPAYSPYAVAEHTVAMMLTLCRKTHRAFNRVREGNFAIDGLMGFDFHGRTAGIIGTGKIGALTGRILHGMGCRLLGFDKFQNADCLALGMEYVTLDDLFARSDAISVHCPLTPDTYHLIDAAAIARMKPGVMIVNTSRGAVVNVPAAIEGLKSGQIGHLGLDVYEEEGDFFFEDLSQRPLQDDVLARLLTFPNVLVTSHQAFFTQDALTQIAATTISNLDDLESGRVCPNSVGLEKRVG